MRRFQTIALVLLLSVLIAPLAGMVVGLAFGSHTVTPALTPPGWRVLGVVAGGLALASAVTLFRRPRNRLVAAVLVVMVLDLVALLFRPGTVAAFGIAAIALIVPSVVSSRRVPSGSLVPVVVLSGMVVIASGALLVFNIAMIGMWGQPQGTSTVCADERSPAGGWRLVASENDPGSMGSVSSTVTARLDLLGIFRLQREVYHDYGSKPAVGWVDGNTIEVAGVSISLWSGYRIHN